MNEKLVLLVGLAVVSTGCLGLTGPETCEGYLSVGIVDEPPENATVWDADRVTDNEHIVTALRKGLAENGSGVTVTAAEMRRVRVTLQDLEPYDPYEYLFQYENETMELALHCNL